MNSENAICQSTSSASCSSTMTSTILNRELDSFDSMSFLSASDKTYPSEYAAEHIRQYDRERARQQNERHQQQPNVYHLRIDKVLIDGGAFKELNDKSML